MTPGGLSWSRTFNISVRPSVSRACRVSSDRRRGSLDQADPLISTTTYPTCAPRVISQSQPRASTPPRTCGPRFALISQPITREYLGARGGGSVGEQTPELIVRRASLWAMPALQARNLFQLHEMFDELVADLLPHVDTIAERATTLGGTALGTARMAASARIEEYPPDAVDGTGHLEVLADRYGSLADALRQASLTRPPVTST